VGAGVETEVELELGIEAGAALLAPLVVVVVDAEAATAFAGAVDCSLGGGSAGDLSHASAAKPATDARVTKVASDRFMVSP
jgi:hypothetical protein